MSGEFKGTPGPWEWWTSNSFLRLSSKATGKDGGVIDSTVMRDGHPTLVVKKEDMALIEAAPEMLDLLILLLDAQLLPEFHLNAANKVVAKALGKKQ